VTSVVFAGRTPGALSWLRRFCRRVEVHRPRQSSALVNRRVTVKRNWLPRSGLGDDGLQETFE